jgi:carbamoyltransferase
VYVLGVNTGPHDGSAALLRDGQLVAMVEQERLSRNRYARGESPREAIDACLAHAKIKLADVARIAVGWDVPRLCEVEGVAYDENAFRRWMTGESHLSVPIQFVGHHLAHAASAFYTSGWPRAAIIVVDGRGEDVATTLAEGGPSGIEVIRTWGIEASLGHTYGWAADWVGLTHWGAGKLMGLAAYGRPGRRAPLRATADGYVVDIPMAEVPDRQQFMVSRSRLRQHFRQVHYPFSPAVEGDVFAYADFAASIQRGLEESMLSLVRLARAETGLDRLVMAGGVALNCTANGKIHRSGMFDGVWVPPVPHDAGVSLGAALFADRAMRAGQGPPPRLPHAFWGPESPDPDRDLLNRFGTCRIDRYNDEELPGVVAQELADGMIVAWWQGRAEVGQRALGARSILCDPRDRRAIARLNELKGREPWRPAAPALPAEAFGRFFDEPPGPLADFMLGAWPVRSTARGQIPAAVHADGSARPQVVHPDQSAFYALLREFGERTGVPVVVNTSFNIAGEPIVLDRADALDTFLRSDLDVLVLDDLVIRRPRRSPRPRFNQVDRALSFTPWAATAEPAPRAPAEVGKAERSKGAWPNDEHRRGHQD